MVDGATKSFQQSYNCQSAVDEKDQIIVAAGVTQDTNDKLQVTPLVKTIKTHCGGKLPNRISADAGYFSEDNCKLLASETIQAYIATEQTNQLSKDKDVCCSWANTQKCHNHRTHDTQASDD